MVSVFRDRQTLNSYQTWATQSLICLEGIVLLSVMFAARLVVYFLPLKGFLMYLSTYLELVNLECKEYPKLYRSSVIKYLFCGVHDSLHTTPSSFELNKSIRHCFLLLKHKELYLVILISLNFSYHCHV